MNPQDPQNQQYQPYQPVETPPPTPMGNPFASSDVNFKPHHDRPRIPVGKLLKRLSAVVVAFGMIAGIGYGVNYFLGIADREQQAYNARLAEEVGAQTDEAIYIGTGSDILEVKPAQLIQACPSGYTEKGEVCEKDQVTTVSAAQYSCPSGYTQAGSGASTTCSRIEGGTKESIPASVQATCEAGYTLKNGGCVKTEIAPFIVVYNCPAGFQKTQLTAQTVTCSSQVTVNGTLRTSCPSGYSPAGANCARTIAATASTSSGCPSGYQIVSGQCSKLATQSCPSGYSLQSGRCVSTVRLTTTTDYRCPSGYTESGSGSSTKCTSTVTKTNTGCPARYTPVSGTNQCRLVISATIAYIESCPSGYTQVSTTNCQRTVAITYSCPGAVAYGTGPDMRCVVAKTSSTSYSCPNGFGLSGSTCTAYANYVTSCDSGFAKVGSTCTKIEIRNQDPTTQNTCPATYTIASTDCQREARVAAIQALSCGTGYTREGNNCTKINGGRSVTASPTISYSCAAGFTQVGSGSGSTCEKRELLSSPRIEQQACEEGWSKRIIGTAVDCVRTA